MKFLSKRMRFNPRLVGVLLWVGAVTGMFAFYQIAKHEETERMLRKAAEQKQEENRREDERIEARWKALRGIYGPDMKKAEQGDVTYQLMLGRLHAKGAGGLPKDDEEALYWYRKAAEQGDARAQCLVGDCYAEGKGVEKDLSEAVKWYSKAADQPHGNVDSLYKLGNRYATGNGVEKNTNEAVKWFKVAANHGHLKAKQALKDLGEAP